MKKPCNILLSATLAAALPVSAAAQTLPSAVSLEPIEPNTRVDVTTVKNVYGSCGSAVVQVLGVQQDSGGSFSVDSAAGNADVIIIAEGGRRQISLKKHLSDHNGVACLSQAEGTRLLVWSNCGGSACGDGYSFTVVDPETLKIVAGDETDCNSLCAARVLGDNLPLKIDHISLQESR